jgi:hypothetical protein
VREHRILLRRDRHDLEERTPFDLQRVSRRRENLGGSREVEHLDAFVDDDADAERVELGA